MYEDFARSKAKREVEATLLEEGESVEMKEEEEKKVELPTTHIFQVLPGYDLSFKYTSTIVILLCKFLMSNPLFLFNLLPPFASSPPPFSNPSYPHSSLSLSLSLSLARSLLFSYPGPTVPS